VPESLPANKRALRETQEGSPSRNKRGLRGGVLRITLGCLLNIDVLDVVIGRAIWRASLPAKDYWMIGRRLPRIDAKDKVKGRALYADDLRLPGMLCGMILRSPFPHARILRIDVSRAMTLPGVKAVVTGEDTLKIKYGVISRSPKYMDEFPLAVGKVRFIGDEVAAVAATDPDRALEALDLVEVEYQELPAVFDPEEAQKPNAPQIHDHAPETSAVNSI